jgi:hypothetical protein
MAFVRRTLAFVVLLSLLVPPVTGAQDFRKWEATMEQYRAWLGSLKSDGYRFWVRVDSNHRPHRLYVGEGFYEADNAMRKSFVEIFSHTLAGHPEKFMLIDLFDAVSGKPIGEFGWGGFKLY